MAFRKEILISEGIILISAYFILNDIILRKRLRKFSGLTVVRDYTARL